MSTNKNALVRYKTLDRCFQNRGRMYFIEDLIEECNKALVEVDSASGGIQKRQLYDDIKFMESEAGWSIDLEKLRHNRKVYYRYIDKNFSISSQPINDSEVEQLKSAIQIILRFSGTPQFEWVHEMIPLLESKFGLIEQDKEIMSFESNVDLKGLHFLTPLFNGIINERVLSVKYKDFKSEEPYDITFHPYYLKQYNSRWFVFGFNPENEMVNWNLAIDRIEEINESDLEYKSSNIDWDDYFYDIIGVTRPEDVELQKVSLLFTAEIAPYITTKPLHPSQKHKMNEQGLEVSLEVIPNYEFERLLISFGEQVQIISPSQLKEKIALRLKSAANQY